MKAPTARCVLLLVLFCTITAVSIVAPAAIRPTSEATLRTIAETMNRNTDWSLNIEGHTDNIGDDTQNHDLSARRAAAVRSALIQRGIAAASP